MEASAGCCMEPNLQPAHHRITFSGATGLIVAVVVVAILLFAFPAYRWFPDQSWYWAGGGRNSFSVVQVQADSGRRCP
jgi:hypothetical protein